MLALCEVLSGLQVTSLAAAAHVLCRDNTVRGCGVDDMLYPQIFAKMVLPTRLHACEGMFKRRESVVCIIGFLLSTRLFQLELFTRRWSF